MILMSISIAAPLYRSKTDGLPVTTTRCQLRDRELPHLLWILDAPSRWHKKYQALFVLAQFRFLDVFDQVGVNNLITMIYLSIYLNL
jgi:hypothetical protein